MQYMESFSSVKIEIFIGKNFDIFAQNIDFAYLLEPPRRGSSNEYPHSMFWSKYKKNRCIPPYPSFPIGVQKGYTLHGYIFLMIKMYTNVLVYTYSFSDDLGWI